MSSGHDTCHLVQAPKNEVNLSQLTHPYTPLGFGRSSTGNLHQMNDKIGESDEPKDDATSEDSEAIPGTEPDENVPEEDKASATSETERYWSTKPLYKCLGCGLIWDGNAQCMGDGEECGRTVLYRDPTDDDQESIHSKIQDDAKKLNHGSEDILELLKWKNVVVNKLIQMLVEKGCDEHELNNIVANIMKSPDCEDGPPNKKQKLTETENGYFC